MSGRKKERSVVPLTGHVDRNRHIEVAAKDGNLVVPLTGHVDRNDKTQMSRLIDNVVPPTGHVDRNTTG